MSTAAAQLANIQVRYHGTGRWIPRTPITADIPAGSSTVIIGPSGCGKSTLALTLNGAIPHSIPSDYSGSLTVTGSEVAETDVTQLARSVALVMQDPDAQIVTSRVWDEVCFALENLCLPTEEIDSRAAYTLKLLQIEHLADRDPWTLSGGQRQRVVLAGALAQKPDILVLDEPTANLDPVAAAGFYKAVGGLVNEGMTVVIIEHNLDDLIEFITHVIALDSEGRIITQGSPEEVFSNHALELIEAGIRLPSPTRLGILLDAIPYPITRHQAIDAIKKRNSSLHATGGTNREELNSAEPVNSQTRPSNKREIIKARGLRVARSGRNILSDINLSINAQQMVALIGANGSGKSTLLRTLAGLERPRSGTVSFSSPGQAFKARRSHLNTSCTLVTQNPEHQFVTSDVRAELSHSMRIARHPHDEINRTVERLLAEYALDNVAHHNPFTLSGGQKRRLSVAAALTIPRDLLLLDEPTFGQDANSAEILMGHMCQFCGHGGAVLFATHDLELAASYAHRIIVMNDGEIVADGPTDLILTNIQLLTSCGLLPPPLVSLAQQARDRGAKVAPWIRWEDVPLRARNRP
ncbi:ABC transporter ATP-binding protein [Schaalia vaccimaxillae]|uniref:ABC transporter ATP-binding protein n=1 Tax=Schaalia vaccimaxillae TaxID=183916 RepID=UPI0003B360AC|nr:ATP-binding cassette domain-containing protein [Schaalia vaccimaxillae]